MNGTSVALPVVKRHELNFNFTQLAMLVVYLATTTSLAILGLKKSRDIKKINQTWLLPAVCH